jgi:hypothetical protein
MFRFFLFMAGVMAVGACAAEDVSPCPVDAVPIQIMEPGGEIQISTDRLGPLYFQAFVETVTEHIAARLTQDKLCVNGAKDMENMHSAEKEKHSLLQFVLWPFFISKEYLVPVMPSTGNSSSCQISSPWIDLVVDRGEVAQIRGIVRWNDRQLLADQAILAGAKNVPPGMAMPQSAHESFLGEYMRTELGPFMQPARKPIEERVPPDILWLFRRSWQSTLSPFIGNVHVAMDETIEKGAEGYTQLVLALIDRCFVPSASGRVDIHYSSIVDVADPVLLEQYKIDTPIR